MSQWDFESEKQFREWFCDELGKHLKSPIWRVLKGKNVADILVAYQSADAPRLFFLEAKWHKIKHGRIGLGGAFGSGYQVEYLNHKVQFLEDHLRWIVGHQKSGKAWFLTNGDVRKYPAGGAITTEKQNNLSSRIFRERESEGIPLADAPKAVARWAIESVD